MLLHGLHNILNINSNLLFSVCVICVRELVDIDPLASTVELCCTFVEL